MRLLVEPGVAIEGQLSYREAEYSFNFNVTSPDILRAREGGAGRSSVSLGTLQIEVGTSTGTALFVWGLHPRTMWMEGQLPKPLTRTGVVRFDDKFETAVSKLLASVGEWSTIYDPDGGWLRVAPDQDFEEVLIEIASGVVLGEKKGRLSSVWLNPAVI